MMKKLLCLSFLVGSASALADNSYKTTCLYDSNGQSLKEISCRIDTEIQGSQGIDYLVKTKKGNMPLSLYGEFGALEHYTTLRNKDSNDFMLTKNKQKTKLYQNAHWVCWQSRKDKETVCIPNYL